MGNSLNISETKALSRKKKRKSLPIESIFKLPSSIPSWPQGDGFASGEIDLGEIQVRQVSTFNNVWTSHQGGQGNVGATFFEPNPIPEGFHMFGCYSQSNNNPLFGWTLIAKAEEKDDNALAAPIDYSLVWSTENSPKLKREGNGYFWLPTAPDGYKSMGFVVTVTAQKPSLEKVRCVRSDLTEQCEGETWIWGLSAGSLDTKTFNVFTLRPSNRGTQAVGVPIGTFSAQMGSANPIPSSIACLKNTNSTSESLYYSMPNLEQISAIFKSYSPLMYFHPNEKYVPSSVDWYFLNGAVLYKKGEESNPIVIDPTGSNLPLGGANDEEYWIDLPVDKNAKEMVKKGDLNSAQVYLHAKAMFGSMFTDVAIWIFYPFNGPGKAKVGPFNVSLGRIGEHIGDWEHLTLRVSNFNGGLEKLYLSEHSKGIWVNTPDLEFVANSNKPVVYSSLSGHANYAKPGLVLQGSGNIGIRNDTAKSRIFIDTGSKYDLVASEYLLGTSSVVVPPWLNYLRKWGPKIDYNTEEEFEKVEKVLIGGLKAAFRKFVRSLPSEVFGEDGPTGPKVKGSWSGDEAY